MAQSLRLPNLIILASSSINRINLLKQIGVNPIVIPPDCEENLSKKLPPEQYAMETANIKNDWVYNKLIQEKKAFDVIISCDTIIVMNNEIIGKPVDLNNARETLEKLNGKTHQVITGVVLKYSTGKLEKFYVKSNVMQEVMPFKKKVPF
ncbi:Maf-like protein family-containing protein [Strongyloides ratti]|uniref:Maf-like protein family-containing protein n=1 Tax=Strongyloides ratti TaxID=34506 RepID=A0A090MWK2_STRRB|nr:Maf-like protein family-containing protein [Strongyloides ratti]CEF63829.1 Maf-like protein family-containing protein [Strongyloides ratti]